jgi:hypothetical protein
MKCTCQVHFSSFLSRTNSGPAGGVLFSPEEEVIATPDAWGVQMFRSIDARSAEFERSSEGTSRLNRKKGR